ncbi:MAG: ATP-binding cassette domain-containing protein, partial [Chloroflexota bacterium]
MNNPGYLIRVNQLSKSFESVVALSGVKFSIEPGQVLGVVGQRGAGKSTLFQILSGAIQPTSGEIYWHEERIVFADPTHTRRLGIEATYQYPVLAENLNALDNVFLGKEVAHLSPLNVWPRESEMLMAARKFFHEFRMPPEIVFQTPRYLSNEQKQVVALAKALIQPAKLLLLDDPLAALSYERQQKLLLKIKDLSAQNVSVIMSSDDLNHI